MIRINRVYLKNFGVIPELDLNLKDGITIFHGKNGHGKSTIIKALSLALFNKYEGSLGDYCNWNASKKEYEIKIEFELEHKYSVRIIYEDDSTTRLLKDHTSNEGWKNSACTSKLADILDPDLYLSSVLSFASSYDFITTQPSKRRERLKKIQGLEFQEQLKKIESDLEYVEEKIKDKEKEFSVLKENTPSEEDLVSEYRYPFNKKELEEKKEAFNEKSKRIESLKQEKIDLNAKVDKKKSVESNIEVQNSYINSLQSSIDDLEVDLKKLDEEIEDNSDKIRLKYYDKEKDLREQIDEKEGELDSIELVRIPTFDQERWDKLKEEKKLISYQIEEEKRKLKLHEQGVCPECGQKLSEDHKADHEKKLEELNDELAALHDEGLRLELEKNKIEDLQEKQQKDLQRKSVLENEINNLEKQISNLDKDKNQELEDEINRIKKERNKRFDEISNKNGKINTLKEELNENESERDAYQRELHEIVKNLPENLDRKTQEIDLRILNEQNEIDDLHREIKQYEDVELKNNEVKKQNSVIKQKIQEAREKLKKLQDEIDIYHVNVQIYKQSKSIVSKEFPAFVISRSIPRLENIVNDFINDAYGRYELEISEKKDSIHVYYKPKGKKVKEDVRLSSDYERQLFALAYQLGLCFIQGSKVLVLDEPDSKADEDNSMIFYKILGALFQSGDLNQLFLISHKRKAIEILQKDYDATVISFTSPGKYGVS